MAALDNITTDYADVKTIFKEQTHPAWCSLVFYRNRLRRIRMWPLDSGRRRPDGYKLCNLLLLGCLFAQMVTVTLDLFDSRHSAITLGDDVVILLGIYLIVYKMFLYSQSTTTLDAIVGGINEIHCGNLRLAGKCREVRDLQRRFFIYELAAHAGFNVVGFVLVLALCVQPLFTGDTFPVRCMYPFGLHDTVQHPHFRWVIYLLQGVFLAYIVYALLMIDSLGCAVSSQTALNLRILCIRLRALNASHAASYGRLGAASMWHELRAIVHAHQLLISLVERTNACLYWSYVAQMGASTFIICLTAFEALLATAEPMMALKFEVYMIASLCQLFYWCGIGNIMYYDSLELANAAFEVHRWFDETPAFQRNLMFVIQRAQTPLMLRPKPIFGFNFATFATILSTSYSYFALLRTMLE